MSSLTVIGMVNLPRLSTQTSLNCAHECGELDLKCDQKWKSCHYNRGAQRRVHIGSQYLYKGRLEICSATTQHIKPHSPQRRPHIDVVVPSPATERRGELPLPQRVRQSKSGFMVNSHLQSSSPIETRKLSCLNWAQYLYNSPEMYWGYTHLWSAPATVNGHGNSYLLRRPKTRPAHVTCRDDGKLTYIVTSPQSAHCYASS